MKNLLIILSTCITLNVSANCNLTVLKKSSDSKTAYLTTGETLSKKMIEKLDAVCTIDSKLMSESMKRELKIKRLRKQLKKLGAK